jgi:ABC-type bacteriocin/lantibiotic exporter with double-glycine peptidase domain
MPLGQLTPMPASIMRYVLRQTGRHQIVLALLSIAVFALSTAPLELQRRIVNDAIAKGALRTIFLLALAYAGVALVEQLLKLTLNVYRGWVAESSVRHLRTVLKDAAFGPTMGALSWDDAGVEIAMIVEEAEPIGGFTALSLSEPLLQGGILANVIGYMLFLNVELALLCLAFFLPQTVFVPLLQRAINRRAAARILTKREISAAIVEQAALARPSARTETEAIQHVFTLNMGIYKLKYSMNLLMNLMHHLSIAVALCVGGWFAIEGRIEVGTVVAIVGGLGKLNDPWGDLVSWAREFSVVAVKYRLFLEAALNLRRIP